MALGKCRRPIWPVHSPDFSFLVKKHVFGPFEQPAYNVEGPWASFYIISQKHLSGPFQRRAYNLAQAWARLCIKSQKAPSQGPLISLAQAWARCYITSEKSTVCARFNIRRTMWKDLRPDWTLPVKWDLVCPLPSGASRG